MAYTPEYLRKRGLLPGGGDRLGETLDRFGRAIPAAGQVGRDIAAEGARAPAGTYGALQTPIVSTVGGMMKRRGAPQRYEQGYGRVTRGFGAQTGRLAGAGAKRGYTSRAGVATGAAGAPSAALATGLGRYQVDWEKEMARQQETGVGLAAQFREDIGRYGQGVGAFAGEFARPQYGRRRINLGRDYMVGGDRPPYRTT